MEGNRCFSSLDTSIFGFVASLVVEGGGWAAVVDDDGAAAPPPGAGFVDADAGLPSEGGFFLMVISLLKYAST